MYEEEFLIKVRNSLVAQFNSEEIDTIVNCVVLSMDGYEVSKKSTEVAIRDNTSDEMIKLYCGTLLSEGKSRKTVKGYMDLLNRFKNETDNPILKATTMEIRIWLSKMQQRVSLRTCENYRSYLSSFYQWLFKEEIIDRNPMLKINPIKYTEPIKKPFSDIEIDKIRKNCNTLRERAEFEFLLASGVRATELSNLDLSDINFDNLSVLVRCGKGGKQRNTYITELAAYHLKKYLSSRNDCNIALFINKNGDRLSKDALESDFRRFCKRTEVENVHPHRCRRTFATSLLRKGCDIRTIQQLLGHSDINTTMIYLSLSDDNVRNEYRKYA